MRKPRLPLLFRTGSRPCFFGDCAPETVTLAGQLHAFSPLTHDGKKCCSAPQHREEWGSDRRGRIRPSGGPTTLQWCGSIAFVWRAICLEVIDAHLGSGMHRPAWFDEERWHMASCTLGFALEDYLSAGSGVLVEGALGWLGSWHRKMSVLQPWIKEPPLAVAQNDPLLAKIRVRQFLMLVTGESADSPSCH
jgi:hypothetical protein